MVCGGCSSSSSLGEVLYWRARLLRPAQHRTRDFLSPLRCAGSCFFSSSVGQSSQSNQYGPPVAVKGFLTLLNYLLNTSYLTDSYISFTLKLESRQNFALTGPFKSSRYGKKKNSDFPPCGMMVIFVPEIVIFLKLVSKMNQKKMASA